MTWYQQVDERLAQLRAATLRDKHVIRDEFASVKNRLESHSLEVNPETLDAVSATVQYISSLLTDQPDQKLVFTNDQFGSIEANDKAQATIAPSIGDLALIEWIRFHRDNLSHASLKAAARAFKFGKLQPLAAVLVFPPELFRIDYRNELRRLADELDQAERRVKQFSSLNRSRRTRSPFTAIVRLFIATPSAAFDSLLEALTPRTAARRRAKGIKFGQRWKNDFNSKMEKFDKDMHAKGMVPHQRYIELEKRSSESINRVYEEIDKVIATVGQDCSEAFDYFVSVKHFAV